MANFHVTGDKGKAPLVEEMEERNPSGLVSPINTELEGLIQLLQASKLGYTVEAPLIPRIGKEGKQVIVEADEIGARLAASNQSLSSPPIPGTEKVLALSELPQPKAPCPQLSTENAEKMSLSCAVALNRVDRNEQVSDTNRGDVVDSNSRVTCRTRRRRTGGSQALAPMMTIYRCSGVAATGGLGVSPQDILACPGKSKPAKKKKQLAEINDSVDSETVVGSKRRLTETCPVPKPAFKKIQRHAPKAPPIQKTADNQGTSAAVIDPYTPSSASEIHSVPTTGAPTPPSQPAFVFNARPWNVVERIE